MFNPNSKIIINKFNKALKIVADYYQLKVCEPTELGSAEYYYNFIEIKDGGGYEKTLKYFEENYKFLVPFFQIWMAEVNAEYALHITENTFKEMNRNIEIIKAVGGRSKSRICPMCNK